MDFIRGAARDVVRLSRLLPYYTHVIWLAAIVGDGACELHPELTVDVNQNAVRWLKRALLRLPGSSLLLFLYKYVFRLGFLDGVPGLIYCGF